MRVRTDEKRQDIIRIAGESFVELGYDRTSMSLISQRLGGSKATLYGYFKSKEELLLAVIENEIDEKAEMMLAQLHAFSEIEDALFALACTVLNQRLSIRPTSFFRIMTSQPEASGIGKTFYETILRPAWMRLFGWVEEMMDEGRLRRADPWLAAMHFKGLIEGDIVERRLLGAHEGLGPREIEAQARAAARAFLKLYGPDSTP